MKRTGFGPRKSSLKRTTPLANKQTAMRRSAMKSRVKKPTVAEGSKYLSACRGEPCYLQISHVCCRDWETVVPAHSNQSIHGKGMGIKAEHRFTIPACFTCHAWLDTGPASQLTKAALFNAALYAWEPVRAQKMGLELEEA
jgi:hypothetical protein